METQQILVKYAPFAEAYRIVYHFLQCIFIFFSISIRNWALSACLSKTQQSGSKIAGTGLRKILKSY
ncbi:MAG: hypothetical protein MR704_01110, partial [Clostridia bacterium]|nr:hypothetical protein [Clostridia bacterium]